MATTTSVLGLTKPAYSESADVSVINSDMDLIDAEAGRARGNIAADYSASQAYAVGDLCLYTGVLYRCKTAIGSGGEAWNSGHWDAVKIAGQLSSLSDQIGNITGNLTNSTATNITSVNDLKNYLSTVFGSMANFASKIMFLQFSSGFAPFGFASWSCLLTKQASDEWTVLMQNATNRMFTLDYKAGTWYIDRIDHPPKIEYIEPTFTNGIANYDMSSKLANYGYTTLGNAIAQLSTGAANSFVIRGTDKTGNTLKIVMNDSSVNGTYGIFVMFFGA